MSDTPYALKEPYVTLRANVTATHKRMVEAQQAHTLAKRELDDAVGKCLHTYDTRHDYVPHMVTDRDPMSGYVGLPRHEEGLYRRVEVKTCTRCGDVKK